LVRAGDRGDEGVQAFLAGIGPARAVGDIGAARIEKMRHGEEDTHRRILAARPPLPSSGDRPSRFAEPQLTGVGVPDRIRKATTLSTETRGRRSLASTQILVTAFKRRRRAPLRSSLPRLSPGVVFLVRQPAEGGFVILLVRARGVLLLRRRRAAF